MFNTGELREAADFVHQYVAANADNSVAAA